MKSKRKIKTVLRYALTLVMVMAGCMHIAKPEIYVRIMPDYLPWHLELVYISGVFEILGGLGLLVPRTRRFAALGLVALYLAVFPANLYMAMNNISLGDTPTPTILLWLRLPMQLVFIAWAWWYAKDAETN